MRQHESSLSSMEEDGIGDFGSYQSFTLAKNDVAMIGEGNDSQQRCKTDQDTVRKRPNMAEITDR